MKSHSARMPMGAWIFFSITLCMTGYFTFNAVQGDFGLFSRTEIMVERVALEQQLAELRTEVSRMENLTHRLSDNFLDIDLLDQQARDVLGMIRSDEIVAQ